MQLVAGDVLGLGALGGLEVDDRRSSVSRRRIRSMRPSTVMPGATWTWICFSECTVFVAARVAVLVEVALDGLDRGARAGRSRSAG